MSRTKRNIEYAKFFSRPKTQKYRRDLNRTKQEIFEILGPNYLNGNNKDYKQITSYWDDNQVSAKNEVLSFSYFMERIFECKVKELYFKIPLWLKYDFNKHKHRIEIGLYGWYLHKNKVPCVYIPFYITHKTYKYPVILLKHRWSS